MIRRYFSKPKNQNEVVLNGNKSEPITVSTEPNVGAPVIKHIDGTFYYPAPGAPPPDPGFIIPSSLSQKSMNSPYPL